MTRLKLKLLLTRINSRLERIFAGTEENGRQAEEMLEKLDSSAFTSDLARAIMQRWEGAGGAIPMANFEGLVRDLLILLDRLENLEKRGPKLASLRFELEGALERAGLEPISVEGIFDPLLHSAKCVIPGPSSSPRIVQQLRPGYRIRGKVVRPAEVVIEVQQKN